MTMQSSKDDTMQANAFTQDYIPDLNNWLQNTIVPSNEDFKSTNKVNENLNDKKSNQDKQEVVNQSCNSSQVDQLKKQAESIRFLNLNNENGKQIQILTSLSYLSNEQRLSVLICKLKIPFYKNLYQQFYKRLNTNQNYFKIYQQLELIKQTKYIFVKIYLIDSITRKRISKKKSSLMSIDGQNCILNNNPYDQNKYLTINELMIFKLPINELKKITIRLSVLGLSSLSHLNQFQQTECKNKKTKKSLDTLYSFGSVEIGYNSISKTAFLHFQNLLSNLRRPHKEQKPICMWHHLDLNNKQVKRKSILI